MYYGKLENNIHIKVNKLYKQKLNFYAISLITLFLVFFKQADSQLTYIYQNLFNISTNTKCTVVLKLLSYWQI